MSLIINFVPAFTASASAINAFFTGGKDPGENSFYLLTLLVWWLGFLVLIQATQVQLLGRELRSCCTPPLAATLLRSIEQLIFFFKEIVELFSRVIVSFYIPTTMDERSNFSASLPAFGILYCRHSDRCIIILLVGVPSLSCVILCDHMDCSNPGSCVLHYLLEFAHIHIHWVGGAIYPSKNIASWSLFAFPKRKVVLNIFSCAYLPFTYLSQWRTSSCLCTVSIWLFIYLCWDLKVLYIF